MRARDIFFVVVIGALFIFGFTVYHENVHKTIMERSNCEKAQTKYTWRGGGTICLERDFSKSQELTDEEKLHLQNEIVEYNHIVFQAMVILLLSLILVKVG